MPNKTVDDWVAKGWTAVELAPGASVAVTYDANTQDLNVKRGQVFDVDGNRVAGADKPRVKVEDTDSGANIIQPDAAYPGTVTVLYRVVEDDDDDGVTAS
jgi:hypothetical protein